MNNFSAAYNFTILSSVDCYVNPDLNAKSVCGEMLLYNLADPEWITIGCYEPLTEHTFCISNPQKIKPNSKVNKLVEIKLYKRLCILKNDMCYNFQWHNKETTKNKLEKVRFTIFNIEMFQYIFDAVRVELSPFIIQNAIVKYSKFGSFYHYETKKIYNISAAEGFVIYLHNSLSFELDGYTFKCSSQMYISIQFVCDGINDCSGDEAMNEKNCKCNQTNDYPSNCKTLQSFHGRKTCSLFYIKTVDGHCHLYNYFMGPTDRSYYQSSTEEHQRLETNFHSSPENFTQKGFSCNNVVNISSLLVNDLVSDCGPEADDEPLLKSIATGNRSHCINKNHIPCRKDHSKCFNISEICTYHLNHLKHLIPCRTGEHLENCGKFECNMMFKCPDYYCIPWSYVCDGVWDCPQGYDESIDNVCRQSGQCANLYKCRNASRSLHVNDICNGNVECPLGDAEYFCKLCNITCPSHCQCLTFVLKFYHNKNVWNTSITKLPYHIIHVRNSTENFVSVLLNSLTFSSILHIKYNGLVSICNIWSHIKWTIKADFGFNSIVEIAKNCFFQSIHVKNTVTE